MDNAVLQEFLLAQLQGVTSSEGGCEKPWWWPLRPWWSANVKYTESQLTRIWARIHSIFVNFPHLKGSKGKPEEPHLNLVGPRLLQQYCDMALGLATILLFCFVRLLYGL